MADGVPCNLRGHYDVLEVQRAGIIGTTGPATAVFATLTVSPMPWPVNYWRRALRFIDLSADFRLQDAGIAVRQPHGAL